MVNPRTKWPFSIAFCMFTGRYRNHFVCWAIWSSRAWAYRALFFLVAEAPPVDMMEMMCWPLDVVWINHDHCRSPFCVSCILFFSQSYCSQMLHEHLTIFHFAFFHSIGDRHPLTWVNYNISLTWILRPCGHLGMIPLTNYDYSEGDQWGCDQIYPDGW